MSGSFTFEHRVPHLRWTEQAAEGMVGSTVPVCGMTLCARGRWYVWPVDEPDTCTCGIVHRRSVWTGKDVTPPGGFLGPDEKGWDEPQHYAECPQTWLVPTDGVPGVRAGV